MSDDAGPPGDTPHGELLAVNSGFVHRWPAGSPQNRADLLVACVGYGMDTRAAIQLCNDFPPFGYFADEQGPELGHHLLTFADGLGWSSPPPRLLERVASEPPAPTAVAEPIVVGFRPSAVARVPLDALAGRHVASAPVPAEPPPPAQVRAFSVELYFAYRLLNISPDGLYDDEFADALLLYVTGMSTLRITTGQQHGIAHVTVEVADRDPGLDPSDWELVDVARLPPLSGGPQRWLQGGFDGDPVLVWDEPGAVMVRVGSRVRDPDGIEPVGPDGDIELPPEEYVIQLWPTVHREGELAGIAPLPTF